IDDGLEENGVGDPSMMGGFIEDDNGDDGPIGEVNPFANEPPSWLRDETSAAPEEPAPANPYRHESRSLRDEDDNAPIPLPKTLAEPPPAEEPAPDNPYLHESRNLRDEEADRPIPLPQGMDAPPDDL